MGAVAGLEPYLLMAEYLAQGDDDVDDYDFIEDEVDDDGLLDRAAVEAIRRGTSTIPDLEAAERLVDQVGALMVSVSTGGPRIEDVQASYKREYRALAAVLKRLGIRNPNSMDDLWRWHGRWSDGTLQTYASRRAFVAEMYAPVRDTLEAKGETVRHVATGTGDALTGWAEVDSKIGTLRRRMSEAETADDFKAVGLQCVALLEALGRAAFVPSRHLPTGEAEPHPNDARNRVGFFLRAVATGDRFEEVRPIIRAAWRQAQAVKHRDNPNRTDAGISADASALLVAIVRRLADEEEHYHELAEAHYAADDDVPF
jgi:hypothetical protein